MVRSFDPVSCEGTDLTATAAEIAVAAANPPAAAVVVCSRLPEAAVVVAAPQEEETEVFAAAEGDETSASDLVGDEAVGKLVLRLGE